MKSVFALVDEVCAPSRRMRFHAGMDEVFYIGEDQCPRCKGRNKAELFADECAQSRPSEASQTTALALGDRLLDGKLTGSANGASRNDTHAAVDLIRRTWSSVTGIMRALIDGRLLRDEGTRCGELFLGKNPDVATEQVKDMLRFRESSTPQMKQHFSGRDANDLVRIGRLSRSVLRSQTFERSEESRPHGIQVLRANVRGIANLK